ncbi:molybdate ABC transporter substrate-binding protein [Lutimonas sp.]|uniref:molybdate ABC transporter substrate-binding protein n=1 Tax=Lutimonas sp. TaxID=1872403 RepID=UPI003C73260F
MLSCKKEHKDKLRIAVAANLQFAIKELADDFSQRSGVECEIIISSSGKLTAQIIEGAPFDLLLSADMKYPQELYNRKFTLFQPDIYAYGNLILWTLHEDVEPELETLLSEQITHIAIGNPKTAPYGVSAMEVLRKFGIEEAVQKKLVYGESIAQTNQFIISRSVDLGFTSKSVVMSSQMKDRGQWSEIDKDLYSPMAQGMVVLKSRKSFESKAIQFRDYVLSSEGKEILHKFGYDMKH